MRDVYEKVCSGDPVTDKEILDGYSHFSMLDKSLSELGPVFMLAAAEARRIAYTLLSFAEARQVAKALKAAPRKAV